MIDFCPEKLENANGFGITGIAYVFISESIRLSSFNFVPLYSGTTERLASRIAYAMLYGQSLTR